MTQFYINGLTDNLCGTTQQCFLVTNFYLTLPEYLG
jgi:hypothetical protein